MTIRRYGVLPVFAVFYVITLALLVLFFKEFNLDLLISLVIFNSVFILMFRMAQFKLTLNDDTLSFNNVASLDISSIRKVYIGTFQELSTNDYPELQDSLKKFKTNGVDAFYKKDTLLLFHTDNQIYFVRKKYFKLSQFNDFIKAIKSKNIEVVQIGN